MLEKKDPGDAGKRNLNVTAVRKSNYSAGTANAASRFAPHASKRTNGA